MSNIKYLSEKQNNTMKIWLCCSSYRWYEGMNFYDVVQDNNWLKSLMITKWCTIIVTV